MKLEDSFGLVIIIKTQKDINQKEEIIINWIIFQLSIVSTNKQQTYDLWTHWFNKVIFQNSLTLKKRNDNVKLHLEELVFLFG